MHWEYPRLRIRDSSVVLTVEYGLVQGAFFLGVNRPGRQADYSPPSSAEVKNVWSCICTPPMRLVLS